MKRETSRDVFKQQIKRAGDNCFLVKQEFTYNPPQKYRFEFAELALFRSGCITCGNENNVVENYGERHCCKTCLNMLQTPTGELVQLRPSSNGRNISGTAIRNNQVVENVKVDIDDLRIRGNKCYATFAGERGEIIVLLKEILQDNSK